jgi:large subunit ribosomal protein L7e
MRDNRLIRNRSVPTADQILVPETLLKKRKSQEKAREERSAEFEKKKKVRGYFINTQAGVEGLYDA